MVGVVCLLGLFGFYVVVYTFGVLFSDWCVFSLLVGCSYYGFS